MNEREICEIAESMYKNLKTEKAKNSPDSDKKNKKSKWISHQNIKKIEGEKNKLKIKSSWAPNKIDRKESV